MIVYLGTIATPVDTTGLSMLMDSYPYPTAGAPRGLFQKTSKKCTAIWP